MKKFFMGLLALTLLGFSGCKTKIVYVEKVSEPLSQSVYASYDSVKKGRFDLAERYTEQTTKLVPPPKERIDIKPIIKPSATTRYSDQNPNVIPPSSTDTIDTIDTIDLFDASSVLVIVPESLRNSEVVIVGSEEYEQLLQVEFIAKQLQEEKLVLNEHIKAVDQQARRNHEVQSDLVKQVNLLSEEILKKDKKLIQKELALVYHRILIVTLLVVIAGGIYLRMKGIL